MHDADRVPPIVVGFMLTCYWSPDPATQIGAEQWDSEAGQDARKWLREHNLIDGNYRATERGQAWVEYICRTPLPEPAWSLPHRSMSVPPRISYYRMEPLGTARDDWR